MSHPVRTVAMIALVTTFTACALQPRDPRADVRGVIRAYFEAVNRADASAIMDSFSRNPEATSVYDGEIARGWEAIRKETDKMAGIGPEFVWAAGTMEVLFLGREHALVVVPVNIIFTSGLGREELAGATTLVLEKEKGKWKVLHEHHSLQPQDSEGGWDSGRS